MTKTAPASPEEPNENDQQGRAEKRKRRARGDGGLHWDKKRKRWIASLTVGYTPAVKRIVKKGSGKTKTEAKDKLKENIRDHDDGLAIGPQKYTVADAVTYWLQYGLKTQSESTVGMYTSFADKHVIPALGARKLRDLSAEDVDRWLAGKTTELSTRSLKIIHSILKRSVRSAMIRDKVKRNVADLCEVPEGREGRASKALTLAQAEAVLAAAEAAGARMRAYIVLSLLIGARTEELRALTWAHVVAYDPKRKTWVPVSDSKAGWDSEEFAIYVWRSVRKKGDTKTKKSRRTLKMPQRCVVALRLLSELQAVIRGEAGDRWLDKHLVFCTRTGTPLTAHNVRRDFRLVLDKAGLNGSDWAPRELRHSFVSVLSDSGMPLEDISRLVGHGGTTVTETVYRQEIRPVMQTGATAMDRIFSECGDEETSES
jgi:integrase